MLPEAAVTPKLFAIFVLLAIWKLMGTRPASLKDRHGIWLSMQKLTN